MLYTFRSVSEEGTYYLVKNWRVNRKIWASEKDVQDNHWLWKSWFYTTSARAMLGMKSLLEVMPEYRHDNLTLVTIDFNKEVILDAE